MIRLTRTEFFGAACVGALRMCNALFGGWPHHNAAGLEMRHVWSNYIEGAMAECAASKALGVEWLMNVGYITGDVGPYEVREAFEHNHRLILHPTDKDDKIYILVTGHHNEYELRGWIFGRDGKQPCYWEDPKGNRPAYFVPRDRLHPMASLPAPDQIPELLKWEEGVIDETAVEDEAPF